MTRSETAEWYDSKNKPKSTQYQGIIDINDQALALQLVYVKRMALEPAATDFLTLWLLCFFQPFFKSCPPFLQLLKLLTRLPPLDLSSSWSLEWVLDLPLPLVMNRPFDVRSASSVSAKPLPSVGFALL
ncbi:hypothetical protein BD560DRAFT_410180 [Blakeslea trispora]|nr:hypothetical protein BD560DRAFT_410180 [Blakeslea trispora]